MFNGKQNGEHLMSNRVICVGNAPHYDWMMFYSKFLDSSSSALVRKKYWNAFDAVNCETHHSTSLAVKDDDHMHTRFTGAPYSWVTWKQVKGCFSTPNTRTVISCLLTVFTSKITYFNAVLKLTYTFSAQPTLHVFSTVIIE